MAHFADMAIYMRILIVTQWFQPEPHFKGLDFAKALRARGHQVEVLTGFPNYPGGKVYAGYRVRLRQREIMDGIPVTRGYLYPSHDRSAVRRVANYISFALSSSALALRLTRPDVVYVYTPPMTAVLPALTLHFLRGVPFVPDIQDLWPDTLSATGMLTNKTAISLIGRFVRFALHRAAGVIVLSPGFRDRLLARGVSAPIHVIPNWAPPEITSVAAEITNAPRDGPFTVLFAGNMGTAQGLDTVLDAARLLADDAVAVRFVFVGGGVDVDRLRALADAQGTGQVEFHRPRHPAQMGDLFEQADALLVHLVDDPLFHITIPSKTQAYLAIGKPVLMGVKGDAARLVEEAAAGLHFEPQSAPSLAEAVKAMIALRPDERAAMGARGKTFYDRHLAFEIGVDAIERSLVEAAECHGKVTKAS